MKYFLLTLLLVSFHSYSREDFGNTFSPIFGERGSDFAQGASEAISTSRTCTGLANDGRGVFNETLACSAINNEGTGLNNFFRSFEGKNCAEEADQGKREKCRSYKESYQACNNGSNDISKTQFGDACNGAMSSGHITVPGVTERVEASVPPGETHPELVPDINEDVVREVAKFLNKGGVKSIAGVSDTYPESANPTDGEIASKWQEIVKDCNIVWEREDIVGEVANSNYSEENGFQDNPYIAYQDYGECKEAFGNEYFTEQDNRVPQSKVMFAICRDLAAAYQKHAKVTFSANETIAYIGDPELRLTTFEQYFGAKRKENSEEVVADVKPETKRNALKTFHSLMAPCIGLRDVVEAVSAKFDEDNYPGLREDEFCFTRFRNDTDYPKSALDYGDCKRALKIMAADDIGNNALAPTATAAVGQVVQADINGDATVQAAQEGGEAASFEAARRRYKLQRDLHIANGALKSGAGLVLLDAAAFYSTPKLSTEKICQGEEIPDDGLAIDPKLFCAVAKMAARDNETRNFLWPNQHTRRQLKNRAATSITGALVDGLLAYVAGENAKDVAEVQETIATADFNQPENQIEINNDLCRTNPNAPICREIDGRTPSSTGVNFQFGGGAEGGGGNLDVLGGGELADFGGDQNVARPSDEVINDLSDIVGDGDGDKGGSDFNRVGAAQVSAGRNSASGSGGGGGGGAGGGGGGIPEERGAGGGGGGDGKFGEKVKGKYQAGAGAGGYRAGGSAKGGNKSDPFAALRKKSKRKPSSVIERGLMPKSSRLFEVISKRYAEVSKQGKIQK